MVEFSDMKGVLIALSCMIALSVGLVALGARPVPVDDVHMFVVVSEYEVRRSEHSIFEPGTYYLR